MAAEGAAGFIRPGLHVVAAEVLPVVDLPWDGDAKPLDGPRVNGLLALDMHRVAG